MISKMKAGERVNLWKWGVRGIAFLSVVFWAAPHEGLAHERYYVWSEIYQTLPKGSFELEGWTTFKMPSHHETNQNSFQYQGELEYGITDHWNAAHYERWRTKNQGGPDDATNYQGFKFETKYRLGERGKYWMDPLFYLEWATDPRDHETPNTLEGKIVLSKDIEKFNFTYNQIMESGLGQEGRTEHAFTVGMGYELVSGFRAGFETKGTYWAPGSNRNEIAMGPTLAYSTRHFWVAAGILLGVNHAADDFQARVIVGVPF